MSHLLNRLTNKTGKKEKVGQDEEKAGRHPTISATGRQQTLSATDPALNLNEEIRQSGKTESAPAGQVALLSAEKDGLAQQLKVSQSRLREAQDESSTLRSRLDAIEKAAGARRTSFLVHHQDALKWRDHVATVKASSGASDSDCAPLEKSFQAFEAALQEACEALEEKTNQCNSMKDVPKGQRLCTHCNELYDQEKNDAKACVYHTGQIRFYSCTGCGGEKYHSCCNKCSSCSPGCRTAKHVS